MIEEHNNVGLLDDKFDASQVNNLFKEKFNNDKLKLIVIAACHSEKIAEEIKKKVGKTIVIARSMQCWIRLPLVLLKNFMEKFQQEVPLVRHLNVHKSL